MLVNKVEKLINDINSGVEVSKETGELESLSKDLEAKRQSGYADKDIKHLKDAVSKLNKVLELFNVERRFVIDERTKEVVVKIIDRETGDVIAQIPPEEALERYYRMQQLVGLLFNEKV